MFLDEFTRADDDLNVALATLSIALEKADQREAQNASSIRNLRQTVASLKAQMNGAEERLEKAEQLALLDPDKVSKRLRDRSVSSSKH